MTYTNYIDRLKNILDHIRDEQPPAIAEAARLVAGAVGEGGVVHVFGAGHSHMLAEEAFFRAGGLVAVNPILDQRLAFFAGALESTRAERVEGYARTLLADQRIESVDAAIVISNSGRNPAPVEMALEMAARGLSVIAITNVKQSSRAASRHSSGLRLFEVAKVVIDTYVPEGDAVLGVPGLEYAMGPASTVAGAAIINSIMIEAASLLSSRKKPVSVFPSANSADTTEETLLSLIRPYHNRIRYLDGV